MAGLYGIISIRSANGPKGVRIESVHLSRLNQGAKEAEATIYRLLKPLHLVILYMRAFYTAFPISMESLEVVLVILIVNDELHQTLFDL